MRKKTKTVENTALSLYSKNARASSSQELSITKHSVAKSSKKLSTDYYFKCAKSKNDFGILASRDK